jgi:hypothetical protein
MSLPQLPQDKANHFAYGFIIFAGSSIFLNDWLSLVVVTAFGLSKEIYDKVSKKGNPEVLDFVATITPGIILTLINIIK